MSKTAISNLNYARLQMAGAHMQRRGSRKEPWPNYVLRSVTWRRPAHLPAIVAYGPRFVQNDGQIARLGHVVSW